LHEAVFSGSASKVEELIKQFKSSDDLDVNAIVNGKKTLELSVQFYSELTPLHNIAYFGCKSKVITVKGFQRLTVSDIDRLKPETFGEFKELFEELKKALSVGTFEKLERFEEFKELKLEEYKKFETEAAKIVRLLVDAGADVNGKDGERNTPLNSVAKSDYNSVALAVAKALVNMGADVNINEGYDFSNLVLICSPKERLAQQNRDNSLELFKLFLENGADVNAQLKDADDKPLSDTPLIAACDYGNLGIVQELLRNDGIKVDVKNEDGKTALDKAGESREGLKDGDDELKSVNEIIKLLQKARRGNLNNKSQNPVTLFQTPSASSTPSDEGKDPVFKSALSK
jgi:Ankyrin repeats (3 copies)